MYMYIGTHTNTYIQTCTHICHGIHRVGTLDNTLINLNVVEHPWSVQNVHALNNVLGPIGEERFEGY